jgi:hypothetical protein
MKGLPDDLTVIHERSLIVGFLEYSLHSYQHISTHIETQRNLSQDQTNHV